MRFKFRQREHIFGTFCEEGNQLYIIEPANSLQELKIIHSKDKPIKYQQKFTASICTSFYSLTYFSDSNYNYIMSIILFFFPFLFTFILLSFLSQLSLIITLLMKEAQRVYLKHKFHRPHESSSFKSSVQRKVLDPLPRQQPGPGSYQVTLPLVRPKYEAIFKNNRSIIIKVNDAPAPAFFSKEARFKDFSTIDPKMVDDAFDLRQIQHEMQSKIKNSRRYNFSMARKKSSQNQSSTALLTQKFTNDGQVIKRKGPEWSKYREQRQIWKSKDNPGPGWYDAQERVERRLYIKNKNSWQFRSQTKRSNSFQKKNRSSIANIQHEEQKIKSIHSRHNLLDPQY